jgi:putative ABC transport system permease protein
VAVVSASAVRRFWPNENPIGKRVWFGTTTGPFADASRAVEIVGVAGDVRYEGVDQPFSDARGEFYTSYLQFSFPDTMVIVKSSGDALALAPAMRKAIAAMDPALPIYDVMTLDERIDRAASRPRFNALLLGAFAAAAVLLAALGVYGMLSYSVSSRMREIGVRLALGADASRVIRLVVGEGLRLAAAGAAAGLVATFVIARLARRAVADAPQWNLPTMAAAAGILLAVAALAAYAPARRAGAVDPASVLRHD